MIPEERGLPLPTESTEGGSVKESCDKLFACPYSKGTPWEYAERQSCSKSGWTTIHRLRYALRRTAYSRTDRRSRQHIYRCHILPIKCPSCSQNVESSPKPIKGLENLLQKIRPTKAPTGNASEEDMWKVIYTTLFPNNPKDEIPCPCEQTRPPFFLPSPRWDVPI